MIASNWFCVRLLSGVRLTLPGPSATRRVTSRLKRRRLSGVAVLRHRQAIDILVTLENLDPKDLVVKTMSPSPVIVDSKSTNDRLAAGLADICAMRYLRRLCSTSLTLVVGNEELFSACAIARNRLLEMFRSLAHIALYVGPAPKCEVNAAFWRAGLSRDRCQSGRFQFVTVARDVLSPVLMVITNVVAVTREVALVTTIRCSGVREKIQCSPPASASSRRVFGPPSVGTRVSPVKQPMSKPTGPMATAPIWASVRRTVPMGTP